MRQHAGQALVAQMPRKSRAEIDSRPPPQKSDRTCIGFFVVMQKHQRRRLKQGDCPPDVDGQDDIIGRIQYQGSGS